MMGERIKGLRKSKSLTLKALAALLSTSPGFISEVENGLKMPGSEFLLSLKRNFDVDLNWLLTGEGEAPKEKNPVINRIDLMLEKMPEEAQRDVLKYAEEKKLLSDCLEERKVRKAA